MAQSRFLQKTPQAPKKRSLFLDAVSLAPPLFPGQRKAVQKLQQTLPEETLTQIGRVPGKVATAFVAPAFSLIDLAEQVGVPLAKGEGPIGVDVLGKDRSVTEFPRVKQALTRGADVALGALKATPPLFPGQRRLQEQAIEGISPDARAEIGRSLVKIGATGIINKSVSNIAKFVGQQKTEFANKEVRALFNKIRKKALSGGLSEQEAEAVARFGVDNAIKGVPITPGLSRELKQTALKQTLGLGKTGGALVPGKKELITAIKQLSPKVNVKDLAGLSIAQLQQRLSELQPIVGTEGFGQVKAQIESAEAGQRVETEAGFKGIPSTFPKFLKDPRFRKKELLDKVISKLETNQKLTPKEQELANVLTKEAGKINQAIAQEERVSFDPEQLEGELKQLKDIQIPKQIAETEKALKQVPIPPSKVKKAVRLSTGQVAPVPPTIKEPQALKRSLARQQTVSRVASQKTKKEVKQIFKLTEKIKKQPIIGMNFQERAQINDLKTQLKTTRTLDGLKRLNAQIQSLKEIGKQKFITTKNEKDEIFKIDKEVLINTTKAKKIPSAPIGLVATKKPTLPIGKSIKALALRPPRMFDKLDKGQNFEGPHNQFFFNRANKAFDQRLINYDGRKNNLLNKMREIGITERQLASSRVVDGVKFTVDEMMNIYADAKNKSNTLALAFGNKIPISTIRNVITQLTPQEKALADAIVEDYKTNFPRLRKAFIDFTDGKQDLPEVEGYTPIKRTLDGFAPTEEELAKEMIERQGLRKVFASRDFTKKRIKIPKEFQTPKRLGLMSIWLDQALKQEHFITHGSLVKDFQRMVSDKDFSASVRGSLGEPFLAEIRRWVDRVANPDIYKAYSVADKTAAALRQNAAVAFLGFNLITMLKQVPSIALFLGEVNPVELLGGIQDVTIHPKETQKLIQSLAPQMKHRSLERELEELKNKSPNRYRELTKRFGRKALLGIYAFDKVVVSAGWKAIYNKHLKTLGSETAADIATRAVLRTQPAGAAKDLAGIYASNEFANWFTQFSNQLNQIWNIITHDIPTKARTGDLKSAFGSAMGVFLSAYLISMITLRRPPKDKEEMQKSLTEQFFNYIPIVGRGVTSLSKGFGFTSIPALGGPEAFAKSAISLQKGQPGKAVTKALEGAAITAGLPLVAGKRLFGAIKGKKRRSRFLKSKGGSKSRFLR